MGPEEKTIRRSIIRQTVYERVHINADAAWFLPNVPRVDRDGDRFSQFQIAGSLWTEFNKEFSFRMRWCGFSLMNTRLRKEFLSFIEAGMQSMGFSRSQEAQRGVSLGDKPLARKSVVQSSRATMAFHRIERAPNL